MFFLKESLCLLEWLRPFPAFSVFVAWIVFFYLTSWKAQAWVWFLDSWATVTIQPNGKKQLKDTGRLVFKLTVSEDIMTAETCDRRTVYFMPERNHEAWAGCPHLRDLPTCPASSRWPSHNKSHWLDQSPLLLITSGMASADTPRDVLHRVLGCSLVQWGSLISSHHHIYA